MRLPPNTGEIDVGTEPALIAPRVKRRAGLLISNVGAKDCTLDTSANVVPGNGYRLQAGKDIMTTIPEAWYAVVAASGTTLSYIDDRGDNNG